MRRASAHGRHWGSGAARARRAAAQRWHSVRAAQVSGSAGGVAVGGRVRQRVEVGASDWRLLWETAWRLADFQTLTLTAGRSVQCPMGLDGRVCACWGH